MVIIYNISSSKIIYPDVICDMIKRNESDVGDIVFEILAKKEDKFFCYIVFSTDKLLITL